MDVSICFCKYWPSAANEVLFATQHSMNSLSMCVVNSDKLYIASTEYHFCIEASFNIIVPDAQHIFDYDRANIILLNFRKYALKIRFLIISPRKAIIHKILNIQETILLSISRKNFLIVYDAIAVALQFVVATELAIDSDNLKRF